MACVLRFLFSTNGLVDRIVFSAYKILDEVTTSHSPPWLSRLPLNATPGKGIGLVAAHEMMDDPLSFTDSSFTRRTKAFLESHSHSAAAMPPTTWKNAPAQLLRCEAPLLPCKAPHILAFIFRGTGRFGSTWA